MMQLPGFADPPGIGKTRSNGNGVHKPEMFALRAGFDELEIKLTVENRKRGYRITGPNGVAPAELQPSVTQILAVIDKSNALVGWARNQMGYKFEQLLRSAEYIPDRETPDFAEWLAETIKEAKKAPEKNRDDAADFGHLMHSVIAGDQPALNDLERQYLETAETFLAVAGLTPLQPELPVWHPTHKYAGTIDLVARDRNGAIVVLDWKTGGGIRDDYAAQVSAYGKALQMLYGGTHPLRAMVVRVNREGETEYKEADVESGFATFMGAWRLWRELNGFGGAKKEMWR